MRNEVRRWLIPVLALIVLVAAGPAFAACTDTINDTIRSIATANFFLQWSLTNPEELDTLVWIGTGSANLTNAFLGGGGDVEFFGNSWAPPEISQVLVGAGTVGTGAGSGFVCVSPTSNIVNISSVHFVSGAPVAVHTQYHVGLGGGNKIRIKRDFNFGSGVSLPSGLRPYMPRLHPRTTFSEVLHPDATNTVLQVEIAASCEFGGSFGAAGCVLDTTTSPHSWNGNDPNPAHDWFAINDPATGKGMIIRRDPTPFINVALWIDQDFGSFTNVSSVLMRQPGGGFVGVVTEVEFLCFYDLTIWPQAMRNALLLPPGC